MLTTCIDRDCRIMTDKVITIQQTTLAVLSSRPFLSPTWFQIALYAYASGKGALTNNSLFGRRQSQNMAK